RTYVYSTSLPVPVVAAAHAALLEATDSSYLRDQLWERTKQLGAALGRQLTSPIVAVIVGSEEAALKLSRELLQRGFHVPAIRPPTVAPGSARLRITLSSAHSEQDVNDLVHALQQCGVLPRRDISRL
ncbi:hypothetical protein CYMTET_46032, partial [Cymbomonas tetramitiformis]